MSCLSTSAVSPSDKGWHQQPDPIGVHRSPPAPPVARCSAVEGAPASRCAEADVPHPALGHELQELGDLAYLFVSRRFHQCPFFGRGLAWPCVAGPTLARCRRAGLPFLTPYLMDCGLTDPAAFNACGRRHRVTGWFGHRQPRAHRSPIHSRKYRLRSFRLFCCRCQNFRRLARKLIGFPQGYLGVSN